MAASRGPAEPTRRPRARIRPEALAAARGGAVEGLAWLGRTPESKASILVRLLSILVRFLLYGVFRFRLRVERREWLPGTGAGRPAGGYLLVAGAHRGWMDPFVVLEALPLEPRVWFLGSGPSTFAVRLRERLAHRVGGLLPVWRGGVGIDGHVEAVRAVLANGGVVGQMPEGNVNGPAGAIGPFRPGAMLIALRTGAPIVPMAIAGTEELYIGRRMAARILAPTTFAELCREAGVVWDGVPPATDSRVELDLAKAATAALAARIGPVVEALHPATIDPPGRRRLLRHRLTWLLLGPGRLDRD